MKYMENCYLMIHENIDKTKYQHKELTIIYSYTAIVDRFSTVSWSNVITVNHRQWRFNTITLGKVIVLGKW